MQWLVQSSHSTFIWSHEYLPWFRPFMCLNVQILTLPRLPKAMLHHLHFPAWIFLIWVAALDNHQLVTAIPTRVQPAEWFIFPQSLQLDEYFYSHTNPSSPTSVRLSFTATYPCLSPKIRMSLRSTTLIHAYQITYRFTSYAYSQQYSVYLFTKGTY